MLSRHVLSPPSIPGAPLPSSTGSRGRLPLSGARQSLAGVFLLAAVAVGCSEAPTGASGVPEVNAAKGGVKGPPSRNGDPTVESTDPKSASQNTTLDVHVFGSNYDEGSVAAFLLDGVATGKVRTNSTTFVSDRELIANVTIDADAEPDLYDVEVTTLKGKKGVGIELFEVVTTAELLTVGDGVVGDGGGLYMDTGVFEHVRNRFRLQPQCAGGRTMSLVNVIPPGYPADQSICNDDGPSGGWVFLHLPDLLTIEGDCDSGDDVSDNDCPFLLLPSFEKNKNWEKNGIVRATGAFAPTAHYFQADLGTGKSLDFVFQDSKVVLNADGTMTYTASEAHFYHTNASSFLCEGDEDGDPETIDDCMDVAIPIELRVRPGS